MKRRLVSFISLSLLLSSCGTAALSSSSSPGSSLPDEEEENNVLPFPNADFEYGTLENWTSEGECFSSLSAVKTASKSQKAIRHIAGDFYLDGFAYKGDAATGSLLSPYFEVTGNGKLSFLLGGGADPSLAYLSFLDREGNEITRKGNDLYYPELPTDRLYRQEVDLSSHLGEEVAVRIVDLDEGTSGFNHLLVDDFRMNSTLSLDTGRLIDDANNYGELMKETVPDTYRHRYHLMPSYGWMNDPNGFLYDGEKFHLFYQANPYDAVWGNMSWGHATSADLLTWEDQGFAITPDQPYDKNGCFSGGAAMVDGTLRLLYTSVGEGNVQTQSMATSYDGVSFSKSSLNPVIGTSMSMGSRATDFRDPYVFEKDGTYYALVGGKLPGEGGQVLLYSSKDFRKWKGVGVTMSSTLTGGGMFECPNVAFFDDKAVLFLSPQGVRDQRLDSFQNVHSVVAEIGSLDLETGKFTNDYGADAMLELDKGFDFYATQIAAKDGKNYLVAWMNHWSRSMPTSGYGWAGEVTLPRELELKDGCLYQHPVSSIYEHFENEASLPETTASDETVDLGVAGNCLSFKAKLDVSKLGTGARGGLKFFAGPGEETLLYYDRDLGMLVFDRRNSGIKVSEADDDSEDGIRYAAVEPDANGCIELEFFLDVSSLECFVNGGEFTMTGLVYPSSGSDKIELFADGGSVSLLEAKKWDIDL